MPEHFTTFTYGLTLLTGFILLQIARKVRDKQRLIAVNSLKV